MRPDEPAVVVGRVTRAHGVRGEVAVLVLSEVEGRFDPGATVFLADGRRLSVTQARPHGGRLLVAFEGIADRTAAEQLLGRDLLVAGSISPELPPGSYWDHELIGCEVVTEAGISLGPVRDVIHTLANDVWVAGPEDDETLVPAISDVIVSVDIGAKRVVVREVPGLTSPER